ncbi:nuclear transport factor 2 family protein [Pedobacter sp.]
MISNIITEQKVKEAENLLLNAMNKSDIEMLDELLYDDLLFVLPNGEVITKQMDLETHKSGKLILEEINSSIDNINFIQENVVVTLNSKIKGKMLDQNFEGNFRYIRVWKIFDDKLKVIAGSCLAI